MVELLRSKNILMLYYLENGLILMTLAFESLSKLVCWVLLLFMDSLKLVWRFIVECTVSLGHCKTLGHV